jgi:L-malate glycosyltransferase
MNIIYMISTLNYGGAEKQAILDANMLSKEHKVIFVTFNKGPLAKLLKPEIELILLQKRSYFVTSIGLKKIIKQYNIKFIHASLNSAMLISVLAALFTKSKVFWHCHSHEYELSFFYKTFFKFLSKLPVVKKIFVVNQELLQHLSKNLNYPHYKMEVLYNTSSLLTFQNKSIESEKIRICYIGRLVELKRVHLLIELADYLINKGFKEFEIIIVGDGELRSSLEKLSLKKNLDRYLRFEGFKTELEPYFDKMDIFALPSREECLSMSLIDAGMKGVPAIAFNTGGNNEIIANDETGFIVRIKEEFFERVFLLIINRSLREKMGKAAVSHCQNKFGEAKHIAQLNAIYTENQIK